MHNPISQSPLRVENPLDYPLKSADVLSRMTSPVAIGCLVIAIAAFSHSFNMFGYPLYLGDEGIYMSQAYAVAQLGKLTPYTYWYDHSPVGWLQIALWTMVSGGFNTFGTAIDSGRVLMLLFHLGTVLLLYTIILKQTGRTWLAFAAAIVYTLSPLSLIHGRRVLLDNIMAFWMMASIALFLNHRNRVLPMLYSGICYGIAVLSKENAILLLPAFTYGLWSQVRSSQYNSRFSRLAWLFPAGAIISTYLVFAALRGELFHLPSGASDSTVSLFGTLFWQTGRKSDSLFLQNLKFDWLRRDYLLLLSGAIVTLTYAVRGNVKKRFVSFLSALMFFSLMKGGAGLDFYILPMLPLLAMINAFIIHDVLRWIGAQGWTISTVKITDRSLLFPIFILLLGTVILGANLWNYPEIFTLHQTKLQHDALAWVRQHVPTESRLAIDDDLWVDLQAGGVDLKRYPHAHSHWKIEGDPEIYHDVLRDDWRNIDYFVLTPGLGKRFSEKGGALLKPAYLNSDTVAMFDDGTASVEIRQVRKPTLQPLPPVPDAVTRGKPSLFQLNQH
jgi:4-amino-4-deoxy-L-arabinose transferase-like glycosyltransferase